MRTKTIHLSDNYRLTGDAVVEFAEIYETKPVDYENNLHAEYDVRFVPTVYKIGARVMLVSHTDVSPNALRSGKTVDAYSLVFGAPDGISGNTDRNIKRYHGWRGTTQDVSCYAHGLREIIKIRELKNGRVAVTVGQDLTAGEA